MFKFKVDIFNEISWQKFTQLPEIKLLPLNEQTKKYNLYINELTYERNVYLKWLVSCCKVSFFKESSNPR